MKRFLLSVFLSFLIGTALYAQDDHVQANALQKTYESIRSIQAHFSQTYRSKRFGEKKAEGTLWIVKPGKMRWSYSSPKGREIVADGKTLTLFDPEDQQANMTEFSSNDLPAPLSFLWGKEKISDSFDVEAMKKNPNELHFRPKKPIPNVKEIYLTLSPGEPRLVVTSRVVDAFDGENEIHFSDIKTNVDIADRQFIFSPPATAKIVKN